MKVNEIVKKYNIENDHEFFKWLTSIGAGKSGWFGYVLEEDIEGHVTRFKEYLEAKEAKELAALEEKKLEEERERLEEEKKQFALANMLITSGFNFDGYTIKKYSGYISGDDAIEIERGTVGFFGGGATNVGNSLTDALVKIRRQAIKELKEAAYDLGCNAVIGVDFDYITLEPETANSSGGTIYLPYVFCVTANGNAVIIEKTE